MNSQNATPGVLLLGASTRAMAFSAIRAGLRPSCIDLFADVDLKAVASVESISPAEYPLGLIERTRQYPTTLPVIYTGGLENHPAVYEEIAQERPVWGYVHPDPMQGKSVRNPEYLDNIARGQGYQRPRHGQPRTGWLVKPRAGAGGRGIRPWKGEALAPTHFAEEYLEGISYSAVYVRVGLQVQLLGITRQLVGEVFVNAPTPFTYCGSIGPARLDEDQIRQLDRLGKVLVNADGYLQGIFGIDFILHDEEVYLIEVNPRYTASVELLELAMGYSLLGLHCQAFGRELVSTGRPPTSRIYGKAICYASTNCVMPADNTWLPVTIDPWLLPTCADIPAAGTVFKTGEPVITLYAEGENEREVWLRLQERSRSTQLSK